MGYTPSAADDLHVLVQIELTGKTLYYADDHLSMSDGNFYEGRLEVSTIQRAFSSFDEPKQRDSMLTIRIIDTDEIVRGYLDDYVWAFKTVKVLVGKGRNLSDYSIDYYGVIKFPGGISYNREYVTIKLRDARNKESKVLPANKYWNSDYPNLEEDAEGKPIPIGYGDWSATAVPVVCTDTTINEFKIADGAIKSIEQVYKNGLAVSHSDENLTTATFRISSYDPDNDTVTVKFKGHVDGSSNLLENPVDILEDIQVNRVGIASGELDSASYDALRTELTGTACRRFITDEFSSNTLIEELALELDFDVFIDDGKYTVQSRLPGKSYDTLFDETNIKPDSMSVAYDPEGLYANRISYTYDFDPVSEEYGKSGLSENLTEQTNIGKVILRTMTFKWLYTDVDVTAIIDRLIIIYSQEIRVVTFTGLSDGILASLGSRVGITFSNFSEHPLLVRGTAKSFLQKSNKITGYDALSYVFPGFWMGDSAPDYASSTETERETSGYWTNDDGEASPGDPDSKISKWY